jgi:integrase
MFALWRTAATTGARRGELLGLRWAALDLDAATMRVEHTVVMVDGKATASTPKTKRSSRTIALDAETARILRALRARQREHRLALGPAYDRDADLVFCHEDGSAIRPDGLGRRFQRLAAAAGVPEIRFHDLRHTHATLALQAGVHPKVVSDRLGHSSVAFTLDVYSAFIPAMQSDAAEAIAGMLVSAR